MNNLEKLTEATILALQGKLIEKENPKNRVINAKIRQADKYIDDGSFDINKARQNYKDRTGKRTV